MPRRAVHAAYAYFTRDSDDPTKHTCDACDTTISSPKTASNLISHLRIAHKEQHDVMLNDESERKKEKTQAPHEESSMRLDDYVIRSFYKSTHPKQVGFGDGPRVMRVLAAAFRGESRKITVATRRP